MNSEALLGRMQPLIDRVGGARQAGILAVGAAVVVLILGFSWWAARPAWAPLYSGLPLESVGPMTEKLNEGGVPFRIGGGGTELSVPAPELARARVLLAGAGLTERGRPGLELFDQPSWGMTDFSQRVNYRRALEGELERTIGAMRGIEKAQVHLAMSERSTFLQGDRPTEASVVLALGAGRTPEPALVKGIQHLVASSVDGVRSDDVMVLDDNGRLLSASNEPGSPAALANRRLENQREVEKYLEGKAAEIVAQAVGHGNARVQVSADLSFDRVQRTTESVDPDRQALASEQRSEIIPGPQGGAGSQTTSATYENTRSIETFASAEGTLRRLTVAVLVNDRPVPGRAGEFQPRSPAELERIQALVASAVGLDAGRGDAISVVSLPFDAPVALPVDRAPSPVELAQEFSRPMLTLIGLLLAFFVALRTIRALRPEAQPAPQEAVVALPATEEEPAAALPRPEPEIVLPKIPAPSPVRDRVAEFVEQEPEVALRLVRAWMKDT